MTKDEMIDELSVLQERFSNGMGWRDGNYAEALDMAIELLEAEQTEPSMRLHEWTSDDITFCTAECEVKCYRKPKYIKHKDIPHSYADLSDACKEFEPKQTESTTEDCSMVNLSAEVKGSERSVKSLTKINQELNQDPLHDDCFDCDKFFTCDNKGEDYKTDCPWK